MSKFAVIPLNDNKRGNWGFRFDCRVFVSAGFGPDCVCLFGVGVLFGIFRRALVGLVAPSMANLVANYYSYCMM